MTTPSNQPDGVCIAGADSGMTAWSSDGLSAGTASVIVMTFNQEKLPLSTSHDWVTTISSAAAPATGCGANRATGAASWATWLADTSTLCSWAGRWWKRQLNGPGIGWVS